MEQQLMSMGFSQDQASQALAATGPNSTIEQAADWILTHNQNPNPNPLLPLESRFHMRSSSSSSSRALLLFRRLFLRSFAPSSIISRPTPPRSLRLTPPLHLHLRMASSSSISASFTPRRRGSDQGTDRIDALGRLLTRILRHMASELKLDMRSDGYVRVRDLLSLNMTTFAKVPLKSHTVEDIREAVAKDNKQRFSLLEENGELFIRANQGHTITTVSSESLLKPILSADEVPVCVHGTYKKNLESILRSGLKRMSRLHVHFSSGSPTDGEVISGMRRDVNILIFLDVRKALQDGMKFYISDNKVILTEGFDGVVPVKYFEKIETWPRREQIQF